MHIDMLDRGNKDDLEYEVRKTLEPIYTAEILDKMTADTKLYLLGYAHGCGLLRLAGIEVEGATDA